MTRYVPVAEQSDDDKKWMLEALKMARQAFEAAEVPVGSVFVRNGSVIARARNRTNELMNVGDGAGRTVVHRSQRHQSNRTDAYVLHDRYPASPGNETRRARGH